MVDNWGTGFPDFTTETAISGTASVSGSVVSISGEVSIAADYLYRPRTIVVTAASGGEALGSGLTTSGFAVHSVKIKIPENKTSGALGYGFYYNSGTNQPVVYIGGCSSDRPYAGNGFICSGKGFPMAPGEVEVFSVTSLDYLYAAAETSGNPVSYIVEMR